VLVADLLPAINTKNELLFQITATASSEADGEALGFEESADFTDEIWRSSRQPADQPPAAAACHFLTVKNLATFAFFQKKKKKIC